MDIAQVSVHSWLDKQMRYKHSKEYGSALLTKGNSDICCNVDETWRHLLRDGVTKR